MPTAPSYGQQRVDLAPLPGVRVDAALTPEAAGVGLAQAQERQGAAVAGVGSDVASIGTGMFAEQEEAKRKAVDAANQTAVLRGTNFVDSNTNTMLYDPQNGLLLKRGEDALGVPEDALSHLDDWADQARLALTTPEQKSAFERYYSQKRDAVQLETMRHTASQVQEVNLNEIDKRIDNSTNTIAANGQDQPRIMSELQNVKAAIDANPTLGPEAKKAKFDDFSSRSVSMAIDNLLSAQMPTQAQSLFDGMQDLIPDAQKKVAVQNALKEGAIRQQTQQAVKSILADPTITEADARKQARDTYDGELQDRVTTALEHEFAVRDKERSDTMHQSLIDSSNVVYQTHDVTKIAPSVWSSYDEGQKASLISFANELAKGKPPTTDPVIYQALRMQATGNRQQQAQFAATDLTPYVTKLSPEDFKEMVNLRGDIQKGNYSEIDKLGVSAQSQAAMANEALVSIGLDPTPKTPGSPNFGSKDAENYAQVAQFRQVLRQKISALETQTGRPAQDKDVQAIVSDLIRPSGISPTGVAGEQPPPKYRYQTFSVLPDSFFADGIRGAGVVAQMSQSDQAFVRSTLAWASPNKGKPGFDPKGNDIPASEVAAFYSILRKNGWTGTGGK